MERDMNNKEIPEVFVLTKAAKVYESCTNTRQLGLADKYAKLLFRRLKRTSESNTCCVLWKLMLLTEKNHNRYLFPARQVVEL